ncbi:MAG: HIT domain-containing protein [Planctomycetes bacterium]|nr:HIT domain-containing protein [Planctomycetota bacterium]
MSIFTRIIRGEIPCHRILENELVIAFLDVNPLSPGHALVVPKEEREQLHQLSQASASALGAALPRVAAAILRSTGATAYNVLQNNGAMAHQAVMHVHFHVIPRFEDGRGLGLAWKASPLDAASGAALAKRIAAELDPA